MGNLKSAKTLGGVGSILLVVGSLIPAIGTAVALVGLILVLIAVKYISDETMDPEIFKNYLISFVFAIISLIVAGVVIFTSIIGLMLGKGAPTSDFTAFLASIILALIAFWVFGILSAVFLRKSYRSIHEKTKVSLFSTTATIYLIGACLLIVIVGALILFVAMILQIVAFFSLPDSIETHVVEKIQ